MKLIIFSSTRSVREFYEQAKSENALLPKAMSLGEFLERVLLCKDTHKRRASKYEALLLMQKACLECKKSEEVLKIPSNFFAFLKNYEYLFSFFNELVLAQKSVQDIRIKDAYALFDEHLDILDELFKIYLFKLDEVGLYDDLSLKLNYALNLDFLDEFSELVFHLDGFLNAFDEELWREISKHIETKIILKTSKFNMELFSNLSLFENLNLSKNKIYELDLSQNKLLSEKSFDYKADKIKLKAFELRSLQASFVFNEISEFVRSGIESDKIALIVPDEEFCELLRLFDKNNMLNFASGINIAQSLFYQRFNALFNALCAPSFAYDERDFKAYFESEESVFDINNTALKIFGLENFKEFKEKFHQKANFTHFENFIKELLKSENTELCNKINEELFYIKSLLKENELSLKELFELFLMQIKSIRLSHVNGGAVRVLGLLEGRNLSFEGLIIVDFNEEFIPKQSVNSMFLNDKVRKSAGLISFEKRLNLQRFYYESLIKNASKISICYTQNEESVKSRLLDELEIDPEFDKISLNSYLQALSLDYEPRSLDLTPLNPPQMRFNLFAKALSNSRFESFVKHKRTFFYKHILKIPEARALSLEPSKLEQGIFLHSLLEEYYQKGQDFFDEKAFVKLLDKKTFKPFSRLELEILKLEIKGFSQIQNAHFAQGFRVLESELDFNKSPHEFMLLNGVKIKLCGKIDRVDIKGADKEKIISLSLNTPNSQNNSSLITQANNENLIASKGANLFIFDYKSGKLPDTSSFQLAFYKALLNAPEARACFYSFKQNSAQYVGKSFNELEKALLESFEECQKEVLFENAKHNEHCAYKLIYAKDVK